MRTGCGLLRRLASVGGRLEQEQTSTGRTILYSLNFDIHRVSQRKRQLMRIPTTDSVFIHIPKTGGSSISERLKKTFYASQVESVNVQEPKKHGTARQWIDYLQKVENVSSPSFFVSVYRSPHDRVLSRYLWRLENSSRFEHLNKRMSVVGLWKSIGATRSMHDYLSVDTDASIPLALLNFETLDRDLDFLVRVMRDSSSHIDEQIHINQNSLKESKSQSLPVWTFISKLMVTFTRHRHDYKLKPRGLISITVLPKPILSRRSIRT